MWTWEGAGTWLPLKSAQFPNFRDMFDAVAPEEIREYSPPFLGALQEPGLIQFWTGIVARTAPGWSLMVRAPANMPRSGHYEMFEGIIETDRWFGPLITNMRLTKTDVPIDFRADFPLLQVQPIPRQRLRRCHAEQLRAGPRPEAAHPGGLGRLLRHGGPPARPGGPAARPVRRRGAQAACRGGWRKA